MPAKDRFLLALCAAMLSMAVAGCGSSIASSAKAGPIAVAGSTGTTQHVSVLATAATLNLSMTPTGDKINAGVDWTVTCGGNAVTGSQTNGACGTLAPAHTPGGATTEYTAPSTVPINSTITITATVTSNPSQNSSLTLTIVPLPIAVSISANNGIPATLEINAPLTIQDVVTNDSAGAGVIWSATCGSSACGSFNPTVSPSSTSNTTYTAPSVVPTGGTVTISATSLTDTTKSASATLTITPPPPPPAGITVSVSPANVYAQTVGAAHVAHLTAFVAGDTTMAGVDWSVSCDATSCGAITAHTASGAAANYSAPSAIPFGGTVTITAASTTNPAIAATATATIVKAAPIVVTITAAPPATLTTGSPATLAAQAASDPGNLGVNWTATCGSAGACGSFNLSPAHTASAGQIVYTAPATVPTGGLVTITASSPATTPANAALAFTTIVAQPPSVALTQAPPAALTAAMHAPVSATVTNDVAPGGVTWTVQCPSTVPGGCGFIAPQQTASGATAIYTAPPVTAPGTSVTLTATSVADPAMTAQSNPIAINPDTTLTVHFLPSIASQVQTDATVNLNAAVANDASNAGVDWQVCSSGCGFFTTRQAVPAIPATATTPYVPAVPAVTATTVSAWSNGLPIPYTAPSQPPSSGIVVLAAAHANPMIANSGTIAIDDNAGGPALNGVVQAGQQPVVGSSVALYAAGTGGYASAASQIAAVTTDKNGSFTVLAGYLCPTPTSQMYLVATGGAVGTNTANPNLALMTALGSCGSLGSAPVVVNELTTVASAFATSPFSANDELTGNKSYLYLGADSGNLTGLANAFAAVNNLVDIETGQVKFMSPAGQGTVPYVEINTLADMLHACTATSGGVEGDGSSCGTLFTATDVLFDNQAMFNAIGPTDTLQAVFNIAQHPISNGQYTLDFPVQHLLSLATAASPFQPILPAQPNDWSISVNYTSGGGLSTTSMVGSFAVDVAGNLWITDTAASSAIEWNAVGAALSPSTGFPAGGGPLAIDANGNVWISGNGSLNELTSLGTPAPGAPFKGVPDGGSDMAFDAQGNLWIANGTGVYEFNDLGVAVSPAGGFTNNGIVGIGAIGVDSSNNIWVAHQNPQVLTSGAYAELNNPGGNLIVDGTMSNTAFGSPVFPQLAADSAGDIWGVSSGGAVCEVKPYGGNGSSLMPACYATDDNTGAGLLTLNPRGSAFDGAGTVWIASQGGQGTGLPISPSVLPVVPSQLGNFFPNYLASPSLTAGTLRVAIDGSGNLWVLLANNTVTEYVGAATPVVAPIALGAANKKLAAKP